MRGPVWKRKKTHYKLLTMLRGGRYSLMIFLWNNEKNRNVFWDSVTINLIIIWHCLQRDCCFKISLNCTISYAICPHAFKVIYLFFSWYTPNIATILLMHFFQLLYLQAGWMPPSHKCNASSFEVCTGIYASILLSAIKQVLFNKLHLISCKKHWGKKYEIMKGCKMKEKNK